MLGIRDIKGKIEGILTGVQEKLLFVDELTSSALIDLKPTSSTLYEFKYKGPRGEMNESLLIPRLTGVQHSGAKAGDQISVERINNTLIIKINKPYLHFFKRLQHRYTHYFLFE